MSNTAHLRVLVLMSVSLLAASCGGSSEPAGSTADAPAAEEADGPTPTVEPTAIPPTPEPTSTPEPTPTPIPSTPEPTPTPIPPTPEPTPEPPPDPCESELPGALNVDCATIVGISATDEEVCVSGPTVAQPVTPGSTPIELRGVRYGRVTHDIDLGDALRELPSSVRRIDFGLPAEGSDETIFFVDPSAVVAFPCRADVGDIVADDLESLPCTASTDSPPDWSARFGSEGSTVGQIDGIRTVVDDSCLRFVVDFSSSPEYVASLSTAPVAAVTASRTGTRIDFPAIADFDPLSVGAIAADEARAFLVREDDGGWYLQVAHRWAVAEVVALDNPGRIVIDLVRLDEPVDQLVRPIIGFAGVVIAEPFQSEAGTFIFDQNPVARVRGWAWPDAILRLFGTQPGVPVDAEGKLALAEAMGITAGAPFEFQEFDVSIPLPTSTGNYVLLVGHDSNGSDYTATGQLVEIAVGEELREAFADIVLDPPTLIPLQSIDLTTMSTFEELEWVEGTFEDAD